MSSSVIQPSCASHGYTVFKCNDCSYSFESDFVSPISHILTETIVAPTCSDSGYTLKKCTNCDYSELSDYTKPISHVLKASVTPPTCENEGFTKYSCQNCDFSYNTDHITALTHTFAEMVSNPTCIEQGYNIKTCSVCSHSITTAYTAPTGHDYTVQKKRATSSADGYTLFSCSECDYSCRSDYEHRAPIFTGAYAPNQSPIAKGIDVSSYNGVLDWSAIKEASIDFAIIRAAATQGKDVYFEANYTAAREAGIDVGAYYYVEPKSVAQALECAETIKNILGDKKFEYPIYLDIEKDGLGAELGSELLTQICTAFIEDLQADGYFAALYTNEKWLKNYYDTAFVTEKYDIWYARYLYDEKPVDLEEFDSFRWNLEKYGPIMGMWQCAHTGVINGFSCSFDFNFAYKDYPAIIKQYHYNGY